MTDLVVSTRYIKPFNTLSQTIFLFQYDILNNYVPFVHTPTLNIRSFSLYSRPNNNSSILIQLRILQAPPNVKYS